MPVQKSIASELQFLINVNKSKADRIEYYSKRNIYFAAMKLITTVPEEQKRLFLDSV